MKNNLINVNILKMSDLVRYNGRFRLKDESIAEHSFYVAYNVIEICKQYNLSDNIKSKALEYAVIHDIPEVYTSDLPYPIKRDNEDLSVILEKVELKYMEESMPTMYDAFLELQSNKESIEHIVLKLADTISVVQYTAREITLGNRSEEMKDIHEDSIERVEKFIEKLEQKIAKI